ncbi:hypothetical protein [Marinobacter confluentis]|uniref:Uncharacterized protein n=1 Tax=Marinobacter confluentis TaxID=1697557 RepID=A0A4Z1BKD2_9GAMM|nr:hypothetical protein [Marinobacter confluentis]TGN40167.1 hypothetical protein E5Q11_07735 [Marinobacter confluentis]
MTQIHNVSHHPLPSSILHNGNDVRRQYTRAAAQRAFQVISYKIGFLKKRAADVTQDYQPGMQG